MKKIGFVLISIMLVSLVACSGKFTPDRVHRLKRGMSRTEVHRILGKPKEIGNAKMIDYTGIADLYETKDSNATVIFKNEKVEMVFLNQDVMKLE